MFSWYLVLSIYGLSHVLPGGGDAKTQAANEIQKAEEEFQEASRKRKEANELLDQAYQSLESYFEKVQKDNGEALIGLLARSGKETQEEWIANPPTNSDPALAKSQIQTFYRKTIAAKLLAANQIPVPLIEPLVQRFASATASEGVASNVNWEEKAGAALKGVLNLQQSFGENWSRVLHKETSAGRTYEKLEADYGNALEKLERLRRPDRFHPAYRKIPEGMVLVLGKTYTLGQNTGWDLDSNRTQKKLSVSIHNLYIDRYEVTNKQYKTFLDSFPPGEIAKRIPANWTRDNNGVPQIPASKEDFPVVGVSWEDASAYATWAGKRLPTEDEWEAAARGPESFTFPWGNQFEAWRPNHSNSGLKDSAAVGSFRGDRSECGCFDMAGNVMEWTASLPDGKPAVKLKENVNVILRGGSFKKGPASASSIYRWAYPGLTTREQDIGFRCVQDVR